MPATATSSWLDAVTEVELGISDETGNGGDCVETAGELAVDVAGRSDDVEGAIVGEGSDVGCEVHPTRVNATRTAVEIRTAL